MKRARKTELRSISDLRKAPYNPREIDEKAFEGLKVSLAEFGDLSGIVFNRRTGNLVAGHQRVDALKAQHGEDLAIVDGNIVTPAGEFPVRVVDWDLNREKMANLAANNPAIQGVFTAAVGEIAAELQEFDSGQFEALRMEDLLPDEAKQDEAPEDFPEVDEDLETSYHCPKCGYEWSGSPR